MKVKERRLGALTSGLLLLLFSIRFTGCATAKQTLDSANSVKHGTFLYVGSAFPDPCCFFPTTSPIPDKLASYQILPDGSLIKLGAFDASEFDHSPNVVHVVSGGQWLFAQLPLREFRIDNTGNLVRGADLSSSGVCCVIDVDPSGRWAFGVIPGDGLRAFRIQPNGELSPGPAMPVGADFRGFDPTGNYFFEFDLGLPAAGGSFRFDRENGIATFAAPLPAEFFQPGGIHAGFAQIVGFSADGRHLLFAKPDNDIGLFHFDVFDWDSSTGILKFAQSTLDFQGFTESFTTADDLIFVLSDRPNRVLRFDPATVTISDTAQTFSGFDGGFQEPLRTDVRTHTLIEGGVDNNVRIWKYDPFTGSTVEAPGSPHLSGVAPAAIRVVNR